MIRRAGCALLGATFVLLWIAAAAAAQPAPSVEGDPAPGSVQERVPAEVSVVFPDAQARASHIEVTDPCGKRVDAHVSTVSGRRVTTPVSATASGKYIVRYFGIASVNGHDLRGDFSFRVRGVEGCEAADVPSKGKPGRGIWDLPKGDYAIALGVAAVIGALGGLVYASILGPKA